MRRATRYRVHDRDYSPQVRHGGTQRGAATLIDNDAMGNAAEHDPPPFYEYQRPKRFHYSKMFPKLGKQLWVNCITQLMMEAVMGFGKGALLWMIGIPLPIILLLAFFMHH
jgi:hypothetical protein